MNRRTDRCFWNGFVTRTEVDEMKGDVLDELVKLRKDMHRFDMVVGELHRFKTAQIGFNKVVMAKVGIRDPPVVVEDDGDAYS